MEVLYVDMIHDAKMMFFSHTTTSEAGSTELVGSSSSSSSWKLPLPESESSGAVIQSVRPLLGVEVLFEDMMGR
jgi:hypothetical protein